MKNISHHIFYLTYLSGTVRCDPRKMYFSRTINKKSLVLFQYSKPKSALGLNRPLGINDSKKREYPSVQLVNHSSKLKQLKLHCTIEHNINLIKIGIYCLHDCWFKYFKKFQKSEFQTHDQAILRGTSSPPMVINRSIGRIIDRYELLMPSYSLY